MRKLTKTDSMGKALSKSMEASKIGNKKCGYKHMFKGELNIIPSRLCWKQRK
jgi:hypothetical protein